MSSKVKKSNIPATQELIEIFTKINQDFPDEMHPLTDEEYYAQQIQNLYNCSDEASKHAAHEMAIAVKADEMLPVEQVQPGMVGVDYGGEHFKVVEIKPAKEWESMLEYDDPGGLEEFIAKEGSIDFEKDYLVAVYTDTHGMFGGPGNLVFMYGYEGLYVSENSQKQQPL